jgi:4-amino-4-deoxy-L-arabinose transferase-like glycosyltransferase
MSDERKTYLFGLIALIAISFALRVHDLDAESLFMDESRQISYYTRSLHDIIYYAASQIQPPLDYWIGHVVFLIDRSNFAARLPAALFGAGSIGMLAMLLARYCTWEISLLTGLLMAILPFHLYFSQEARPYSIVMFLLLVVLWQLDNFMRDAAFRYRHLIGLLAAGVLFLYSSALSPLMVTFTLLLVLAAPVLVSVARKGTLAPERRKRYMAAIGTLCIAIGIYLPIFSILSETSRRYAPHASKVDPTIYLKHLMGFSFHPLWKAYVTQLEPIGLLLLPFVLAAIVSAVKRRREAGYFLPKTVAVLLPCAAILHLFAYSANTDYPFRPPYPTYIFPLVLFLAACSWQDLASYLQAVKMPGRRVLIATCTVLVFLFVLHSTWAFKTTRKKADVNGLQEYIAATYHRGTVFLTGGLVGFNGWYPGFDLGKARHYPLETLPRIDDRVFLSQGEPVFLFFYYHNYFLTPSSKYPIIPISGDIPPLPLERLRNSPVLSCAEFIGYEAVRLKNPSGRLAEDALKIIEAILELLPNDASLIDLHVAAAKLGRALGRADYQDHILKAMAVIGPKQQAVLAASLLQATPPLIVRTEDRDKS